MNYKKKPWAKEFREGYVHRMFFIHRVSKELIQSDSKHPWDVSVYLMSRKALKNMLSRAMEQGVKYGIKEGEVCRDAFDQWCSKYVFAEAEKETL